MLGNLSIEQMERRLGVEFPEELKTIMSANRQEKADDIAKDKWHCFDIPFMLVCGGRDFAEKIYEHLKPLQSEMKTKMEIGVN